MPARYFKIYHSLFLVFLSLALGLPTFATTVVTVNRFAGMPDFMRSRQSVWLQTEEGYQEMGEPPLSSQVSCSTMLGLSQQFSLAQMIFRGYLSDESKARFYMGLLEKYHPSQISFLQLSHPDQPHVDASLPNAPEYEKEIVRQLPPVHATLSLVAGQDLYQGRQIATYPVPWQLEDHLKELSKKLDRNVYRFVTEWGRAGQVQPKDIDQLFKVAALLQLEELHAMGFHLADGWVTFHSLDHSHTVTYKRRFGDFLLGEENPETGEAVFLISLEKMFEILKPQEANPIFNALLKEGLSIDQAAYLTRYFRLAEHSEFNVKFAGKDLPHPVMVADFSDLQPEMIQVHLHTIGVPDSKAEEVHDVVNRLRSFSYVVNHPNGVDYAYTPMARNILANDNSLLVTNLDPELAERDPHYVEKMIYAVIAQKLNWLEAHGPEWSFTTFSRFAIEQDLKISVFTKNTEIAKQLALIPEATNHAKAKITTPRALDIQEMMNLVQNSFKTGVTNHEEEIHDRFTFRVNDFLYRASIQYLHDSTGNSKEVPVDALRNEWLDQPEFQLSLGRFAIEHGLMGVSGL